MPSAFPQEWTTMPKSSLEAINEVAVKTILPGILENLNKPSPFLDFLKRNDLQLVYERAKRYGYRNPYRRKSEAKHPHLRGGGIWKVDPSR